MQEVKSNIKISLSLLLFLSLLKFYGRSGSSIYDFLYMHICTFENGDLMSMMPLCLCHSCPYF